MKKINRNIIPEDSISEEIKLTGIQLPMSLRLKLEALAKKNDRRIGQHIVSLLKKAVNEIDSP